MLASSEARSTVPAIAFPFPTLKTVKQQAAAPIPKGTKRTKGKAAEAENPKTHVSRQRQIGPQYAKKKKGKSSIMKDVLSGLVCLRFLL